MEFKFERKTFNINERLRVGIISDSQLSPVRRKNETTFRNNLVLSLSVLKKQGCNMIIFAGDIGNMASGFAYDTYKAAFKSVFGEKIPIIQSIMGNHDYWSESALSANTTKTNPSGRCAAGFGRSQNKILEFNEKQALSDIWQCLLLLYLLIFSGLTPQKR